MGSVERSEIGPPPTTKEHIVVSLHPLFCAMFFFLSVALDGEWRPGMASRNGVPTRQSLSMFLHHPNTPVAFGFSEVRRSRNGVFPILQDHGTKIVCKSQKSIIQLSSSAS